MSFFSFVTARAVYRSSRLTERQIQVLYARMRPPFGLTNREIAGELGLTPTTVSTHYRKAMRNLGIKNDHQLLTYREP